MLIASYCNTRNIHGKFLYRSSPLRRDVTVMWSSRSIEKDERKKVQTQKSKCKEKQTERVREFISHSVRPYNLRCWFFIILFSEASIDIACVSLGNLSGNTVAICFNVWTWGWANEWCDCAWYIYTYMYMLVYVCTLLFFQFISFHFFSLIIIFSCLFRFFTLFRFCFLISGLVSESATETELERDQERPKACTFFFSPLLFRMVTVTIANANFGPWEYFTM